MTEHTAHTSEAPVLVGILASNQKQKTMECLDSLADGAGDTHTVFLVDNGSEDNIGEAARRHPFVTVETRGTNLGCAGGRNVVVDHFLTHGRWPYLFFLDNDAIVPPGAIASLTAEAQSGHGDGGRLGALGPHVSFVDAPDRYWCAGGAVINWRRGWFEETGRNGRVGQDFMTPRSLDTLTGGFMFCARAAVEATGHFLEPYFLYLEDTDWCWRMRLAGFELRSVPHVVCRHAASSSLGGTSPAFYYYRARNRLWFFRSYRATGRMARTGRILAHLLFHSLYPELRAAHGAEVRAILRGLAHGMRPRPTFARPERCTTHAVIVEHCAGVAYAVSPRARPRGSL